MHKEVQTEPRPETRGAGLIAEPAVPGETFSRVAFTQDAVDMISSLGRRHGPLMFHQSGGCCDGSSPMCYPAGDFLTGDADVLLGTTEIPDAGNVEFWMSREQFSYWRHTRLTIDIVPGRGSGFSLEAPEGKRFLIRSQLMNEDGSDATSLAAS
ncbi:DUF779 domain-containing protein [Pseudoclavibacter sp. RFBJ3]|uniref:DUF779 domain-containing protein n=1 Tax=unclassified Pseudoclavibacter TaxID=2615177 RepID=UPI000CE78C35|nr:MULTISPECIES: DUF779 domain-containing protein [unclassified Pseudoclavibacter]PPF84417.1 DUF779 domain-containing protein [Pseudoclavibacter sp. RFBJ5]PPF92682.1 DUF779 domain-containing protein [Pseudoclavibacter sp. RFBJ3]PPF98245.1 DUF779 domain-containing protein [Pseudoclavibacter sp. RFBH5]PPG25315.1 DUF779 domain-containing protein [Pseudoclavibacter sp. RFBI4]